MSAIDKCVRISWNSIEMYRFVRLSHLTWNYCVIQNASRMHIGRIENAFLIVHAIRWLSTIFRYQIDFGMQIIHSKMKNLFAMWTDIVFMKCHPFSIGADLFDRCQFCMWKRRNYERYRSELNINEVPGSMKTIVNTVSRA